MKKCSVISLVALAIQFTVVPAAPLESEETSEELTTVDQVLERYIEAIGGREAVEKLSTRICTGLLIDDLRSRATPIYEEVPIESYAKMPDRLLMVEHTSDGIRREGSNGKVTWKQDAEGIEPKEEPIRSKIAWLLDPQGALRIKTYFPDPVLKEKDSIEGRSVYVMEPKGLPKAHYTLYFDAETGLLVRIGYYWLLLDYREVDGIKLPFRISISRKEGSSTYVFDEVKHNVPIDDILFDKPCPPDETLK